MADGNLCVTLTEAGTWESFPIFAEAWAAQIGARIEDRIDVVDTRLWHIRYERSLLRLVYADFPNGVTVESTGPEANAAIAMLFALVSSEAVPEGN
jgi:hypothetical protein